MDDSPTKRPEGYDEILGGIARAITQTFGDNPKGLFLAQVEDIMRGAAPLLTLLGRKIPIERRRFKFKLELDLLFFSGEQSSFLLVDLRPRREECADEVYRALVDWKMLVLDGLKRPRATSPTIGLVFDQEGSGAPRYVLRPVPEKVGVEFIQTLPRELSKHLPDIEELEEELRVLGGEEQ